MIFTIGMYRAMIFSLDDYFHEEGGVLAIVYVFISVAANFRGMFIFAGSLFSREVYFHRKFIFTGSLFSREVYFHEVFIFARC